MTPRAARILSEVSKTTRVPVALILGPSRLRQHVYARHHAMARVRALVNKDGEPVFSFPAIGKMFSRDHTTAMHGVAGHERRNGPCRLEYPLCVMDYEETRL